MKKYSLFASYLLLGEASVRILGFFANAYLGRILGPEMYGLIIIGGISLLTFSILISDAGIRILGTVETSKHADKQLFPFSDILNIKILHALFSFIILVILTFFIYNEQSEQLKQTICFYYLLCIFFDALFLDWYFKGLQRFGTITIARASASLIYVFSLYVYVKTPDDVLKVPILFFVTNMISAAILFLSLFNTPGKYIFSFSAKKYVSVIKHSLPLGIGTFLNQVTVYLPPFVLDKTVNTSESGYYGAAFKIIQLIMIIDRTFSTIFLTSLPRIWNYNKESAKKLLQTLLHCALAFGALISLMVSIVSGTIIRLLYGEQYMDSAVILSLISWYFTLTMINSIFVYGLIATDQRERYLKAAVIGFILNCFIITILIFYFGKYGACAAILCGELIFIIFCHYEFRKFSSIKFYFPFLKTCLVTGITFYLVSVIHFHIIVKSIIAAVIFGILTILLRIISKDDIALLVTKWEKS